MNGEDVTIVSADELRSLLETAHLLRSPKNAQRLVGALVKAQAGKGKKTTPLRLRKELHIG